MTYFTCTQNFQYQVAALMYLCKEGQKRTFESFIMKHAKVKRSEDFHICQKTVSKARLRETCSARLGFNHLEVLKMKKVKQGSLKN